MYKNASRSGAIAALSETLLRSLLLALLSSLAACSPSRAGDHFVVLLYHHVAGDTPAITSVTPEQFRAHLDYLDDNGFTVWPLTRAVAALDGGTPIPDRTAVITFDDAYRDILENAAPMLAERKWPFTVFVATKAVDEGHGGIMGWEELRELKSLGAELANHTASHEHLIRRREGESEYEWIERVREDMRTASRRLAEETGTDNTLFAWPYGEYNARLDALAEDLDLTAFTQASGAVGSEMDRQRLPRFPVAGDYAELESLRRRFDALPLPVTDAAPEEPQLPADERRPSLTLTIGEGDYRGDRLSCFVSGQGAVEPERLDDSPLTIRIRAPSDLPGGRSRYNCTAPSKDGSRWYWYSQPWFLPNPDGAWPDE